MKSLGKEQVKNIPLFFYIIGFIYLSRACILASKFTGFSSHWKNKICQTVSVYENIFPPSQISNKCPFFFVFFQNLRIPQKSLVKMGIWEQEEASQSHTWGVRWMRSQFETQCRIIGSYYCFMPFHVVDDDYYLGIAKNSGHHFPS